MAIKRRSVLAGSAALWLGAPAIVRAQSAAAAVTEDQRQPWLCHARRRRNTRPMPARRTISIPTRPRAARSGSARAAPSIRCTPSSSRACRPPASARSGTRSAGRRATRPSTEYGLLAETIEWPEDRSWVAFTLRPQARWHDGKPITVEDVIFTFDILKAKGPPNYAFYYGDVLKAEKVGDRKVLFTFRDDTNKRAAADPRPAAVLPSKWWASRDFEKVVARDRRWAAAPTRSSPSMPAARSPTAGSTTGGRKDLWMNRGRNNFDVMRYDYYRDVTVQFEAFKAGEFDIRQENIARNWATAYDFPAVRDGRIQRAEIPHELPTGMQCFAFNTRRDHLQGPRVREALATMFDFEWTNKNLFYGLYKRNSSFFGNSELASSGLPTPAELKYPRAVARQDPRRGLHQGVQAAGDRRLRQRPRPRAPRAGAAQGGRLGDQGRQDDRARRPARSWPSRCC